MFDTIRTRIDHELEALVRDADRTHSLSAISPLMYKAIREFALRDGKRVRPVLFVIGYLGYAGKTAPGLYRSAVSLELLHDFMLVHDDVIDKSPLRRGKPAMHVILGREVNRRRGTKCSGEDLAVVIGDVIYAMALYAFLAVKEDPARKERALKKLIEAALYTGSGEFIELLYGMKPPRAITRGDIYRIYDLKTANYTFSYPLTIGAALAGAPESQIRKLFDYGLYLGRAFQIKDDIIGMFASEKEIGKSTLTDLQESKKTILIWYAYNNGTARHKREIERVMTKARLTRRDLEAIRAVVRESGSLEYARREILALAGRAGKILASLSLRPAYKHKLGEFNASVLKV